MMKVIRDYMSPNDDYMTGRLKTNRSLNEYDRNNLYDNTCLNKMRHFSASSLADIINPHEPWFSLSVKKDETETIRTWRIKSAERLYKFINNSDYYKYLLTDKINYDLYGFSALTITGNQKGGMNIYAEDPFSLYIYEDSEEVIGVFWERNYSAYSMRKMFNYDPEDRTLDDNSIYVVLSVCVPNSQEFIDAENQNKKYVQIHILKEIKDRIVVKSQDLSSYTVEGIEVGERRYYDQLISTVCRDRRDGYSSYGEGWGKRLLTNAINLNVIRRNMLKTVEYEGNPAITAPYDLNFRFNRLIPGQIYPVSVTGRPVETVKLNADLNKQAGYLSLESDQVDATIPSIEIPQKKQRQSQTEVLKMLQEAQKNNFIYKIEYLTDGIAKHLRKMFNIAMRQKIIDTPPTGLTKEDVEPTLASIILKESKKIKASSYVEAISLLQPFMAAYPQGFDNFDIDYIIRNVVEGVTGGEGLLDNRQVNQIRERRRQEIQRQQQQQIQQVSAETQLAGAKAGAAGAKAQKDLASARAEEQQIG